MYKIEKAISFTLFYSKTTHISGSITPYIYIYIYTHNIHGYCNFLSDFFNLFFSLIFHPCQMTSLLLLSWSLPSLEKGKEKEEEHEEEQERRQRRKTTTTNQSPYHHHHHHPKQNQIENPRKNPFGNITGFLRQKQNHHCLEPTPIFLALSKSSCCLSSHS